MFVRVKQVTSGQKCYRYLQVVETRRDQGRVRQHVVANLGRLEEVIVSGDLDRVIQGLVAHSPSLELIARYRGGSLQAEWDKVWGPVLVFERLWEELGLAALLSRWERRRRLGFSFERVVFACVLQRLLAPGSDRAGQKWAQTVHAAGFAALRLPHFYRALGLLWRQKERLERFLYQRDLDLFNQRLDLVFLDTTSLYFAGRGPAGLARRGKSKDYRPDHPQLILGLVMRRDGRPIACEVWPGNTADVTRLTVFADILKRRFAIARVIVVADRGMFSRRNVAELTARGFDYILGMKMRGLLEVRDTVLARAGRYREVQENLAVKEVHVADRRYVICFNPEQAAKERQDREKILAALQEKLAAGGIKKLIPNRGYRRYLKVQAGIFTLDEKRIREEERYDGKYVLRTTTALPAAEVALAYKNLLWIERLFRELKSLLEVRPIYHHWVKDNVKGHIFANFLALYLVVELRQRLAAMGEKVAWEDLIRDLSQMRAIGLCLEGRRYLLRTDLKGVAHLAFQAAGVKPPPLAQPL